MDVHVDSSFGTSCVNVLVHSRQKTIIWSPIEWIIWIPIEKLHPLNKFRKINFYEIIESDIITSPRQFLVSIDHRSFAFNPEKHPYTYER